MRHFIRRIALATSLALGFAAALSGASRAADLDLANRLATGPVPQWIDANAAPQDPSPTLPAHFANFPSIVEHWNTEIRAAGPQSEQYERRLIRIQQSSALTDAGVLRINYSPDYQSVVIHRVDILRAGKRIPELDLMSFRVAKVEDGLERRLLTGKSAAIGQIPDVRTGDVLDIAYTVRGQNPVFGNHYVANVIWNLPQYVHERRVRLLYPESMPVKHYFNGPKYGTSPSVSGITTAGMREQLFTQQRVIPAFYDNRLPSGYNPFMILQLSTLRSWSEVHQWAAELFAVPPTSPAVQKLADDMRKTGSERDAVARAVRFVQDEVRYFSIAVSENTHRPQAPDITLERRFGDCKDKALLLVALLRAMGTQAEPVLVSDAQGARILGSMETPLAFDHAVVRITYRDRKDVMADATLNADGLPLENQAGKLKKSVGLVIQARPPAAVALTPLGSPQPGLQLDVLEKVTVSGLDKEARFEIKTRVYDQLADVARQIDRQIAEKTRTQIIINQFLQRQPASRADSGYPRIVDSRRDNRYEVEEIYRTERLLNRDNSNTVWAARFGAMQLLAALANGPLDKERPLPLGLPMPNSRHHYRVEVEFPEGIRGRDDPVENTIDTPFFKAKILRSFRGSTFVFDAELTVTTDEIAPTAMAEFVNAYEDLQKKLIDIVILSDDNISTADTKAVSLRERMDGRNRKTVESTSKTIDAARLADEDMANVYLQRAVARMDLGLEREAEKDVEQALRRGPGQPLGYQLRATLALRQKHYPAAESDINKALSLGGDAGTLYLRRGQIRYLAGNFAGALKDFEQAEKSTEGGTHLGFMRVWQSLTRARLRQPPQDAKAGITTWPAPLLDVFSGQATPEALIRNLNASTTEEERQLNLCEAYFYLALWADIQNQPERSRDYLKRTVATGVVHFMEYELAEIMMK